MAARCQLITDTGCDLPLEFLQEYNVELLHFSYTEEGKPDGGFHGTDDLFSSISAHDFYDAIRNGATPMTSQPSQGEMEEVFRRVIDSGTPGVYLAFSSGISGCYEGAMTVYERLREEYGDDMPLHIVDTRIASSPFAMFIEEAIRHVEKGFTAEELVAWAEEYRYLAQTIFMVDNLEALHRGGRIPKGVATMGDKLNVKPLISFDRDGRLTIVGVARGRKKAIKKMAEYYTKYHDNYICPPIASIGNADSDHKDIEYLEVLIAKDNGPVRYLETNIGPVCGCHVGAGMMSCCFWGRGPRTA
ncbi:MAG: DegV family protein [Coriobacteriales bacterium]|nr:DegV family protein [Coriobacteriales bacterium]